MSPCACAEHVEVGPGLAILFGKLDILAEFLLRCIELRGVCKWAEPRHKMKKNVHGIYSQGGRFSVPFPNKLRRRTEVPQVIPGPD